MSSVLGEGRHNTKLKKEKSIFIYSKRNACYFVFLHSILDEAEKNLTFNTDDINIYSATHQFELARALNVLHVKASTFHSYYTTGKFDKVS